jgi:dUTP pyrophosphatase
MNGGFGANMKFRGFEEVSQTFKKQKQNIILPTRATRYSAGYDFYSPTEIIIQAYSNELIWTDVKAYMQENEVLIVDVRSSIGINKGLMLANTIGIIDKDYYSNLKNDGNIGICLYNKTDQPILIQQNERIAQGVFIPFLIADNGNTNEERTGGIGSSNG